MGTKGTLPDFRNVGVMLRVLVIAGLADVLASYIAAPDGLTAVRRLADSGFVFELTLLSVVLLLFVLAPWLTRLGYRRGVLTVVAVVVAVAVAMDSVFGPLVGLRSDPVRVAVLSALLAGLVLSYFDYRRRVLSPALSEARLMALQARIRPHFLFNSINTAVCMVRDDPVLAERILLDLADLFRALLADARTLVPLADELKLGRAYLEIEAMRLGDRLRADWQLDGVPLDARVPMLMLQPLLENAVHHGIEPNPLGGEVSIRFSVQDRRLRLVIRNPVFEGGAAVPGNQMALANIEERLMLHFDEEAHLRSAREDGYFMVQVDIPLVLKD